MPLDTGGVTNLRMSVDGDLDPGLADSYMPTLETGPDIGAALKSAREFRGLTLQDVADSTRIRRAYLAAIEEMRLDELPSRPFTIGYVRAYANALGLDGEAAVDRFKLDEPAPDEPLRAPVGVRRDGDPRVMAIVMVGLLIVGAIIMWNIAQRSMSEQAPPPPTAPEAADIGLSPAPAQVGPFALGAPLPAPVESTTPTPYVTPGLEAATAGDGSSKAVEDAARLAKEHPESVAVVPTEALPATFAARGAIFGAPAAASTLTLQARRPTSIIVRGDDSTVYFARQLAAGEAYRAPMLKGLAIDVSDPTAMQVFVAGQSKGLLPAAQTSVAKLTAE